MRKNIFETKSVAEVILMSDLPEWKKWLLRKLMPEELYEKPPIEICTIPKGAKIGSILIDLDTSGCELF